MLVEVLDGVPPAGLAKVRARQCWSNAEHTRGNSQYGEGKTPAAALRLRFRASKAVL
jgi:hypothetical protein